MKNKKQMTPEKYREMANDKSIPQDARNVFLDKAVEMEQKAYKHSKELKMLMVINGKVK
jgi:cytochrome b involved in lipid metabolism